MTCKPRQIIGNEPFSAISKDYNRYCDRIIGNGNPVLNPEVVARVAEIVADGGTVEDITFYNSFVTAMKNAGVWGDIVAAYSPSWGVKGTTTASKLYSIISATQDLPQTLGSKQPAISVGTINGRTELICDGIDDVMQETFAYSVPQTVILMGFKQISWTLGDSLFDGKSSNFRQARQVTASPQIAQKVNASVPSAANSDLAVNTAAHCRFLLNNPTSNNIQVDNNAETGSAIAEVGNMDGFTLASRYDDAASQSNISVGAVICLNSAVDGSYNAKMAAIYAFSKEAYATP